MAEASSWTDDTAAISIVTPGDDEARLRPDAMDVLRLAFDDIDTATKTTDLPFSREQASQVLDFALQHTQSEFMLVHCGAGLSRSAGVALALADLFGWPGAPSTNLPLYNRHVHRTILAEAQDRGITPSRA